MDIDTRLFEIIKKYDIYKCVPEFEDYYKEKYFVKCIEDFLLELDEGKIVAVRGGGKHTIELFKHISSEAKQKITYIIDKNAKYVMEGYQVIHPKVLDQHRIDVIILSSFSMQLEFKLELMDHMQHIKILEPYEYLQFKGVYYDREFYRYVEKELYHVTHMDLSTTYKQYIEETDFVLKKFYLEKMIAQCTEVRDFVTLYRMIEQYKKQGWDSNKRYEKFNKELEDLFIEIREKLQTREQKDIIINWIDNVNAEEFYETNFAKRRRDDSLVFTNAYTVAPWTHFTMFAIFGALLPIGDKAYMVNRLSEENSVLLKELQNYGYKFKYIANPGMYQKEFEKTKLMSYPKGFDKVVFDSRSVSECSSRLLWNEVKERLASSQRVCHLVHNLAETHPPYVYATVDSFYGNRRKYREQGMHYIVEQLEWYGKFYNEEVIQIYLADHGDGVEYLRAYEKGRTNIPLIVKGKGIPVRIENRLYSHLDFYKVIRAILSEEHNWDEVCSGFVLYENVDFYNKKFIIEHIFDWMQADGRMDMAHYQSRGIRTQEDIYVKYATGKELYYRLPDEKTNLINDETWLNRIKFLKEKCGEEFVDITADPMFVESYRLYDYLSTRTNIEW